MIGQHFFRSQKDTKTVLSSLYGTQTARNYIFKKKDSFYVHALLINLLP